MFLQLLSNYNITQLKVLLTIFILRTNSLGAADIKEWLGGWFLICSIANVTDSSRNHVMKSASEKASASKNFIPNWTEISKSMKTICGTDFDFRNKRLFKWVVVKNTM